MIIARKAYFSCGLDGESFLGVGANFTLEVYLEGPVNEKTGLMMNLIDLEKILQSVLQSMDHKHLTTEIDFFRRHGTSLGRIAEYLHEQIRPQLPPDIRLVNLRLEAGSGDKVDFNYGHASVTSAL